jgi:hypothetical protein
MTTASEFRLATSSERFDPDDERVGDAERELWNELREETDAARVERTPVPNAKGFTETLILSLITPGTISAALRCLGGWLRRDPTRVIELTRVVDGREEKLVLRGTGLTDDTLLKFAAALSGSGSAS